MSTDPVAIGAANFLVAVGASAGGPTALAALISALPVNFPAAVVVIQHVDKTFAAGLADWLAQQASLPVRLAKQGDELSSATVFVAGSNDHLILRGPNCIGYVAEPRQTFYRPSIDVFFHSVIKHWRGRLAGVLLTGMGKDGALGLKELRNRGHYTIAQDQATSSVYGMPKAAAALDAAVEILPLDQIAPRLIDLFCSRTLRSIH